ncbi:hypothetical protein HDZ31DRAFT_70788, partial [Schizophyllum fasciatum]
MSAVRCVARNAKAHLANLPKRCARRRYHAGVLSSLLTPSSPEFQEKKASMDALVKDLEEKLADVRQGGGPKAAERMRTKGKKLPRERYVP